jgi:hypothetical protein
MAQFEPGEIRGHVEYLRDTLIPDLRVSGLDATADDFEKCCSIIDQLLPEGMTDREAIIAQLWELDAHYKALRREQDVAIAAFDRSHDGTRQKQAALTEMRRLHDLMLPIEARMSQLADLVADEEEGS